MLSPFSHDAIIKRPHLVRLITVMYQTANQRRYSYEKGILPGVGLGIIDCWSGIFHHPGPPRDTVTLLFSVSILFNVNNSIGGLHSYPKGNSFYKRFQTVSLKPLGLSLQYHLDLFIIYLSIGTQPNKLFHFCLSQLADLSSPLIQSFLLCRVHPQFNSKRKIPKRPSPPRSVRLSCAFSLMMPHAMWKIS